MKHTKYFGFLYLFLCLLLPLFPGEYDFKIEKTISWEDKKCFIRIEKPLDLTREYGPDSRFLAEKQLNEQFHALIFNALLDIQVDSFHSVQDILKSDPNLHQKINTSVAFFKKEYSFLTPGNASVLFRYSCPLYGEKGLSTCFINHEAAGPSESRLGFIAVRPYSGIIIYARGEYPLYGKKTQGTLQPVFFPDIFNEHMEPVYDKSKCDPGFLKQWGMVQYTNHLDPEIYIDRIGTSPLKTSITAIFGKTNSDLILPSDIVDKILCLEANRRLLTEGRVLVICDLL